MEPYSIGNAPKVSNIERASVLCWWCCHPSLIFVGNAGANPSEAVQR